MKKLNQILFSLLIFFFTFYNSAFGENKITIYSPLEVKVTDGDSFRYGDERIRLFGIDAPELKQLCKDLLNKNYKCGEEAKKQLNKYMMLANKFLLNINCYYSERDKYKRILAECYIGGNEKKN